MFVKLSAKQTSKSSVDTYGPIWVNTENVCAIEYKTRFRDVGNHNGYVKDVWYSVTLVGDGELSLDETQGQELLASLPLPVIGADMLALEQTPEDAGVVR